MTVVINLILFTFLCIKGHDIWGWYGTLMCILLYVRTESNWILFSKFVSLSKEMFKMLSEEIVLREKSKARMKKLLDSVLVDVPHKRDD